MTARDKWMLTDVHSPGPRIIVQDEDECDEIRIPCIPLYGEIKLVIQNGRVERVDTLEQRKRKH